MSGTPISESRKIVNIAAAIGCLRASPLKSSMFRKRSPLPVRCAHAAKAPTFMNAYDAR